MPLNKRRLFSAIAFLAVLFLGSGSYSEENQSKQLKESPEATSQQQAAPDIYSLPRQGENAIQTDWNKVECAKPKSHDEADLCEQRRMAKSAENALVLTVWQFGLGAVGALLVLWTLYFTRVAAVAAKDAANAAIKQVELSRQALMETERAFVFVSKMHAIAGFSASKQKVIDWTFYLIWENSGNTPTRNMKMGTNWHSFDNELPDDFDFPEVGGRPFEVPMMLGPKATTWSGECVIPIEVLEDVRMGKKHVYLWGWVEYNDVFDGSKRHRTESCTHLIVAGDPKIHQHGPNNEPMVPFLYNGHRFFNGADGECFRQPTS
jgi:hypothetical protein